MNKENILKDKKVCILLPDGVGLRNFIYTDFLKYGKPYIWSTLTNIQTDVEIYTLPNKISIHWTTDIFKKVLVDLNLKNYAKIYRNNSFLDYIFPSQNNTLKKYIKNKLFQFCINNFNHKTIYKYYINSLRKSLFYKQIITQLEKEKPNFLFSTNQRSINAAIPIIAAKDLGIPTATFIFSWDNMPKGNLSVPAEHLFVWSDYMKKEAHKYYPYIEQNNVHVVGTPQFIPYTDESLYEDREVFCKRYGLNSQAKLICFSGDDITTSPYDPVYLEDTAKAVRYLNKIKDENFQVLFRRCPVDLSDRYDKILKEYSDVIISVEPLWKKPEEMKSWDSIIPTKEDMKLLVNIVLHCETAINVGSTIAHDFACMGKTSCYLNYNVQNHGEWDIYKIYKFIHFQSMEELEPIYWINSSKEVAQVILDAIEDSDNKIVDAQKWLQKIVKHPLSDANYRIWQTIEQIIEG